MNKYLFHITLLYSLFLFVYEPREVIASPQRQLNPRNIQKISYSVDSDKKINGEELFDTITYNVKGEIEKIISIFQNEYNRLDTSYIEQYDYDSLGNVSTYIYRYKRQHDSTWSEYNNYKYFYQFDINNRVIQDSICIFNEYNNIYVTAYKHIFDYNENGSIISKSYLKWWDDKWENDTIELFEYNSKQDLLTKTTMVWESQYDLFMNKSQIQFEYDINSNVITETDLEFYFGLWENRQKNVYNYDLHNNETLFINYLWKNEQWKECYKTNNIYSYDDNNNITSKTNLNFENDEWQNNIRQKYEYNSLNNLVTGTAELYKNNQWIYYNDIFSIKLNNNYTKQYSAFKVKIDYENNIIDEKLLSMDYNCSPMPTSDNLTVDFNLSAQKTISILIYSSTGNLLATLKNQQLMEMGSYSINHNTHYLAPGNYYVTLLDGENKFTNKFIVIR